MKNKHGDTIAKGMIVCLRKDVMARRVGRGASATVISWVEGVKGGVTVSPPLDGFSCWNVDDLEPVPRRNR